MLSGSFYFVNRGLRAVMAVFVDFRSLTKLVQTWLSVEKTVSC